MLGLLAAASSAAPGARAMREGNETCAKAGRTCARGRFRRLSEKRIAVAHSSAARSRQTRRDRHDPWRGGSDGGRERRGGLPKLAVRTRNASACHAMTSMKGHWRLLRLSVTAVLALILVASHAILLQQTSVQTVLPIAALASAMILLAIAIHLGLLGALIALVRRHRF